MVSLSARMTTALKTAIRREERTAEVYDEKAKLTNDLKVQTVLEALAKQEIGHARKLEKVLQKGDLAIIGQKKSSSSYTGFTLSNDDVRKMASQTEVVRVITWAIKAEENSFRFYTSLAKVSKGLEVAELFARLAEEETKHKTRLEAVLSRL